MDSLKRFLVIHGHFYQPPRENPWLEEIEFQQSASPYHDWNTKITHECYEPNGAARVLEKGKIIDIVNNYQKLSFNFGPTLLNWLYFKTPEIYKMIIKGDKTSELKKNGHGNAIAQAYNHMIMPLANEHDKRTQIIWGIEDFKFHFGHKPEGIWLPELAVDKQTLKIIAEQGLKFTILSPHQAKKIKKIGDENWLDVSNNKIDPSKPYKLSFEDELSITIFFYDAPISHSIAFEKVLDNGDLFVNRILSGYSEKRDWPQILILATDGETYGHHHPFGEMALAYAMKKIEENGLAEITNPSYYLSIYQPQWEVEIIENTSWSCPHGLGRWKDDCGCTTGGKIGWNQKWRKPLREAMDWLRDMVDTIFEREGSKLFKDPWEARNGYIQLILNPSIEQKERFFREYQKKELSYEEKVKALKLLEMEKNRMFMYTSCGWFFADISGLEAKQNMMYAARVIQIASEYIPDLEESFIKMLSEAKSNIKEKRDGGYIYKTEIKPNIVDLKRVAAHYSIDSIFHSPKKEEKLFCYVIKNDDYIQHSFAETSFITGKIEIESIITNEKKDIIFTVIHFGGHDFRCSLKFIMNQNDNYPKIKKELEDAYLSHSITELIRIMDHHFPGKYYTLKDLFLDRRREILSKVTQEASKKYEDILRQIYEHGRDLMKIIKNLDGVIPYSYLIAASYSLKQELKDRITKLKDNIYSERIDEIFKEIDCFKLSIPLEDVIMDAEKIINQKMLTVKEGKIENVVKLISFLNKYDLLPSLWKAQNIFFDILKEKKLFYEKKEERNLFIELGELLGFKMDYFIKYPFPS